jgi:hypothetical protein
MSEPSIRRRLLWTAFAAAGLGACVVAAIYFGKWFPRQMSVDELKADLQTRVPKGSTWEEAEAWFASHRIKCFPIFSPGITINHAEKRGLKGSIPDDRPGDPGYIYIEVSGSDGKVWGHTVERRAGSL